MYRKLRAKIVEHYGTQEKFATAMSMNCTTLNYKLNGKSDWTAKEMIRACELLNIPYEDAWLYFFTE